MSFHTDDGYWSYIKIIFGRLFSCMHRYFPYLSAGSLSILLVLFFSVNIFERKKVLAETIQDDLQEIIKDLIDIDTHCNILSIAQNNCVIDFLTVTSFKGSMVGELNVVYPDHWKGPYRKKNHMVQGRLYEIVKLKDCYAVVPGVGVTLPGKKVMGKDIICNETVLAKLFFEEKGLLRHKKYFLGYPLPFVIGDWDSVILKGAELKDIKEVLDQINEAMSFSLRVDEDKKYHVA
ncbi:hypothetical protein JKY79_01235 [Candidatus Babeliales bacterium]|nr:hypothetical protein [Candidatus Babeliales bacterium]